MSQPFIPESMAPGAELRSTSKPGDTFTAPIHITLHRGNTGSKWVTHITNEQTGGHSTGHYFDDFTDALRDFYKRTKAEGLQVDWSTLLLPAGREWVNTCEHGDGIDTMRFTAEAEFDAYCKQQIEDYYNTDFDDYEDVMKLLKAGDVDSAWEMATTDDEDVKELYASRFGAHSTETYEVLVPASELPAWVIQAIEKSLET